MRSVNLKKLKGDLIQAHRDGDLNESTIGIIFQEYENPHPDHSSLDDKELANYAEFQEQYERESES